MTTEAKPTLERVRELRELFVALDAEPGSCDVPKTVMQFSEMAALCDFYLKAYEASGEIRPLRLPLHVVHNSWEVSTVYDVAGACVAEVRINPDATENDQHIWESIKEAQAHAIVVLCNRSEARCATCGNSAKPGWIEHTPFEYTKCPDCLSTREAK